MGEVCVCASELSWCMSACVWLKWQGFPLICEIKVHFEMLEIEVVASESAAKQNLFISFRSIERAKHISCGFDKC